MQRSIEIAKARLERLAHDVYDDCVGIAKQNDLEAWFAVEVFRKAFEERVKESEDE